MEDAGATSATDTGDPGQVTTGTDTGAVGTEPAKGSPGDPGKEPKQDPKDDPRVKSAREEAIAERQKRQAAEARVKELEDAQLSEAERKDKRTAELESENASLKLTLQQREMKDVFAEVGKEAGARVPKDVWRLIDLSSVEFDEKTNEIKNAKKLVESLKASSPEHFLAGGASGRVNAGARQSATGPDMNEGMRDWLSRK